MYERYTNYLERQGYVPESRDYREIDSRSLGEYRGPSVRVSHGYSPEMYNRERFEYSYRDYENTPRNREREPEYVPRDFYPRNPRGFENLDNFTPGYQNRHRVEGSKLSRKNLKAPFFNGETSFKDFLVQFELIAQLAEWDVQTMALELATCLRGSAVSVLSDLPHRDRTYYPTLVQALSNRFDPENQTQLYKAQLRTRIRKDGESIPELAQDINRLVRSAYIELPSELREGIAKDCFIESLNNRELEMAVFQSRPKSLQQAVNVAIEFEAFQATRQRKPLSSVRECVPSEKEHICGELANRFSQMELELEGLRSVKSNRAELPECSTAETKTKDKECFLCGEPGHFKANCPLRKSGKTDSRPRNDRCDYCGKQGHIMSNCWKYKPVKSKSSTTCVYCGLTGHFMIDCEKYKASLLVDPKKPLN